MLRVRISFTAPKIFSGDTMSEPKLFTEDEVRAIVAEEVKKHLRVSGWAGAVDNGCGYSHIKGGASATWDGKTLGEKERTPDRINNSPVRMV